LFSNPAQAPTKSKTSKAVSNAEGARYKAIGRHDFTFFFLRAPREKVRPNAKAYVKRAYILV
jgi:hypothetical protein